MRDDIELRSGRICHPCRQMRERAIALFNDKGALAAKSMFTNNTESFAVARMKSIANRYVK